MHTTMPSILLRTMIGLCSPRAQVAHGGQGTALLELALPCHFLTADGCKSHALTVFCWRSALLQEGDAAKQPEQEAAAAAGGPIDTWTLPENTGRAYAALDGDISPMHLYKATAMLMGFPSPVANVHFLAARTEATIDTTVGECRVGYTIVACISDSAAAATLVCS